MLAREGGIDLTARSLFCRTGMIMRRALFPLSGVYALGRMLHVALNRSRFEGNVPVVIIGNLSAGGTGKTPLAAHFAALCRRAGKRCAVVSRGYKGARDEDPAVVCDGKNILMGPSGAGDEPWMLARMLKDVPVVVGRDRLAACEMAVRRLGAEALILDDGFQQRHRFPGALCVVAINSRQPLLNGALLPAGLLREPVPAVSDAQVLILTHGAPGRLAGRLRGLAPHALVASARHSLSGLFPLFRGASPPVGDFKGKCVMALSAIGYPEGFALLLRRQAHARRVIPCAFPDHHVWRKGEIDAAMKLAVGKGCHAVVITAKDAVKMPRPERMIVPIYVAGIRMEFTRPAGRQLRRKLEDYLRLFAA